ncbi:hypothetical protein EGT07_09390 [Herbaspirillum sp. HC18]|nr:hypothetical protein EGT07_09390 [Herbaspirillum sp. HC18]
MRTLIRCLLFFTTLLASICALPAAAVTCTSNQTGNWNVASTWSGCTGGNGSTANTPGSNDTAIIANGHTVTANVTVTVAAVTVNTGGTLNIAGQNWTVNGATNISGTLIHTSTGGNAIFAGIVTVNSSGRWDNTQNESVTFRGGITNNGTWINSGNATQTFDTNSQVIAGSSPILFGGQVNINSAVTVTNNNTNTVTISGNLTGAANSTWVNGADSTLNYLGTSAPMGNRGFTASASPNTVNYSAAGNQTIKSATYHHLALSTSGNKTLPGALTVNGNFTTSGTASTTAAGAMSVGGDFTIGSGTSFNAGSYAHNLQGNFSNSGTFTPATSTFTFNGSAAQTISGVTSFSSVTIANTSATVSAANNINVSGTLSVSSGAVFAPSAAVVINSAAAGTITGLGTVRVTRVAATADYSSQYKFSTNTLTNLTVEYAGTAAQTVSAITYGGVSINNASGVSLATGTTTIGGTLTLTAGTLAVGGNTLALNGPTVAGTTSNLVTTSSSTLSFGGSSSGVIFPSSVTQLGNLVVNNSNGISLAGSLVVSSTITLTSGTVTTGSFTLASSANCTSASAITRTSGYVLGNLKLTFPSSSSPGVSCTYHVGSTSVYAPMTVTLVSGGGTLTGSTTGNEHPQIATSGVDSARDANRYWTLGSSGDTAVATAYGATFSFIPADLDSSADPTSFVVAKYSGGTWSVLSSVTANSASTSVSSATGPIAASTSFAIGQMAEPACTVPSDLSSITDLTCVCDNFGRASLNPSTINGGNWIVSNSSGSFGNPRIVNTGYLRLTDNTTNVATVATLPGTFPALGNLITVDFKHYAYKGTIGGGGPAAGADGIAVTLSNSTVTPIAGAYGGSLGYAQKTNINGFAGGWLGVGIDEYGNYSTALEGRGTGAGTALIPDSVAARGSGTGSTSSQYPYLAGSGASLSPGIDDATSTSRAPGHSYRIMVDARNYDASNKKTQVAIYRDTSGNGNFSSSLLDFDIYQKNASQADVPGNWKISFTGSTGDSVNIHEISGFKVCATKIALPPSISIDDYSPSTCSTLPNGKPTVTITALNANGTVDITYAKTVTLAATTTLTGSTASNAVFTLLAGTAANWNAATKTYTFSAADQGVVKFTLTDGTPQSVYLKVTETQLGGLTSTMSTPVQFAGGSFTVAIADNLGSELVAGRNHLMKITRNNGCGNDLTYNGTKMLDGWYTPDSSHPVNAKAPEICSTTATAASGNCINTYNSSSCVSLSIAATTVDSAINNLPPFIFDNSGVAYFCLRTTDVGKYNLALRDDVTSATTPMVGTSPTLTARPFAVIVSGITAPGSVNNPAAIDHNGGKFTKVGAIFNATVGGYLWTSAGDDGTGFPNVASASFGAITAGGLAPHYADTVTLSADKPFAPSSVGEGGTGTAGSLAGGSLAITGGSASVSSLSYSEVGSFTLKAAPSASYLGSVDLTNPSRARVYADSSTQTAWVGRFYPDHFALLGGSTLTMRNDLPACASSTFTYMDEPMAANFTLEARDASDNPTKNYEGSYAKLFQQPDPFQFGALDDPTELSSTRLNVGTVSGTWSKGRAVLSVPITYTRPAAAGSVVTPEKPVSMFKLGIAPVDGDGVALKSSALDLVMPVTFNRARVGAGDNSIRFGRLKLSNAHGSELLSLPVPIEAQFFNGTGWVTNDHDNCTPVTGSTVTMNNPLKNLNTTLAASTCKPRLSQTTTLSKGRALLMLSAPGNGNNGSVDLRVNLDTASGTTCAAPGTALSTATSANQTYLRGNWLNSNYTDDPTARATFGVYKSGPVIYIREIH